MPSDGLPETPEARAARWQPALAQAADAELVRRLALGARPRDAADTVRLLSILSGLVWWAAETGVPVSADVLTDPQVAARYAAAGMPGLSRSWRGQALNALGRVSAAHRGGTPGPRARTADQGHRVPGRPYAPSEVDALLRWADGQPSQLKRHTFLVALAGGLGAGLTNADLRSVRGDDVRIGPNGETIVGTAGRAPRDVTVLRRYETLLARLARDAGDLWLLRPGLEPASPRSTLSPFHGLPPEPGVPRYTAVRCRNTWVVAHLTAGTRLDVLAAAAGVAGVAELLDNLRWLPEADPERETRDLRSATHTPDPAYNDGMPSNTRRRTANPAGPTREAAEALRDYRPRFLDQCHAPLVRTVAAATGPRTGAAALQAATAVADLVGWADRHGHPTRTPSDVLQRHVVDGWIAAPDGAARSTPVTRAPRVRRIEQAVAAINPDQRRPAVPLSAPYSRTDLDRMLTAGRALTDPTARHRYLAVVALCVGTGVTAREATTITGNRVRRDPATGTVLVAVPGPRGTRTVPCLAEHEDRLLETAQDAGDGWLVTPAVSNPSVEDLRRAVLGVVPPAQAPAVTALRCRATWIGAQLASGTRADTLLRAAGLVSTSNVTAWVRSLDSLTPEQARKMLRGG